MSARVRACRRDELVPGGVVMVRLGTDDEGRPVEALVLLDREGRLRAYRNLCRHLPIPLGWLDPARAPGPTVGSTLLHTDSVHIVCGTHGALYRPEDGVCVSGPCAGLALFALTVEVEDGEVYVTA